jgi:hypothetical protein
MIKISQENIFVFYIFASIFAMGILWIRELMRKKNYEWATSEGAVCICDKCHFAFLVKPGESLAECPRCEDICVIKKRRK